MKNIGVLYKTKISELMTVLIPKTKPLHHLETVNFVKIEAYVNKEIKNSDVYIYTHTLPASTLKSVCLPDNSDVTFELKTQNPNACNAALLSSEF